MSPYDSIHDNLIQMQTLSIFVRHHLKTVFEVLKVDFQKSPNSTSSNLYKIALIWAKNFLSFDW